MTEKQLLMLLMWNSINTYKFKSWDKVTKNQIKRNYIFDYNNKMKTEMVEPLWIEPAQ